MVDTPAQDRALALSREKLNGRFVTKYDPAIALRICERVAEGGLIKDICAPDNPDGLPHRATFYRWLTTYPDVKRAFDAARKISAAGFEEEAIEAAFDVRNVPGSPTKVAANRAFMEQMRWSAGKRDANTYSDRANAVAMVPIQIVTSLDLGQEGAEQAHSDNDIYTIPVPPPPTPQEEFQALLPALANATPDPALVKPKRKPGRPRVVIPRKMTDKQEDAFMQEQLAKTAKQTQRMQRYRAQVKARKNV